MKELFMKIALKEGFSNIPLEARDGGPFGAVIVKDGEIIAAAHNEVKKEKDPTMHAEISAIRKATKRLNSTKLTGCEIYCSCFPCPMCLGAICWADISKIYYGCTTEDAGELDLKDDEVYAVVADAADKNGIKAPSDKNNMEYLCVNREECLSLFEAWKQRKRVKSNI